MNSPSPYLTPAEAAERYRVDVRTIYAWCRQGSINCFKIGRLWRIVIDGRIPNE